jgi:rhamnogalacturonyl hydrolase YesR
MDRKANHCLFRLLCFCCLLTIAGNPVRGQQSAAAAVLKKIADRIIQSTPYQFINTQTQETYSRLANVPFSMDVKVKSQYNDWHYTNGLLQIAMMELSDQLKDTQYLHYVKRNMEFVFDPANLEYFRRQYNTIMQQPDGEEKARRYSWHMFFRMIRLDDCGVIGASLVDLYQRSKDPAYKAYFDQVAGHLLHKEPRLKDRTIARLWPHEMTIWADDLYMSVCFLARMGRLTGDRKYFDDAAKQVIQFTRYLWDAEKQLYYHCYHSDIQEHGVAYWSRANGWVIMAQADLLSMLPDNHPQRAELLKIFRQQAKGIVRYQGPSGLWQQLLDKADSYEEVTGTAMFTYALATGVKKGWLHRDFTYAAEQGWKGILGKISEQGDVSGICTGTGIMPSLVFYYNRPVETNTPMGEAPVLRAGIAMLDLPPFRDPPAHLQYPRIRAGR